MGIAQNIKEIKAKIAAAAERSHRLPEEIQLLAVTKHIELERVAEAIAAGLREFGENRVQEGIAKINALGRPELNWHLIGSLQTNKVRQAVPAFSMIHSLDRWNLAEALQSRAEELQIVQPVLIEVNVSGEESKHGLTPAALADFIEDLRGMKHLSPQGLMTMAPFFEDAEKTRPIFRELRQLLLRMAREKKMGPEWRHLSMGMSNDFEVAVEEGATYVRVGTAIFS